MKYKDESGQWKDLVLPATGDTLPVGTVVEFEGDTVPSNWTIVEDETNIVTDGAAVKCGYKIDGKDVYAKRFVIGNGPAANAFGNYDLLPFGIDTNLHKIVDWNCFTSVDEKVPILTGDSYEVVAWLQTSDVAKFQVRAGASADLSSTSLVLTVYYTNK